MKILLLILVSLVLSACAQVSDLRKSVNESSDQKLTLGMAQKEIRVGMSEADVATALGSPNMVTKDRDGIETWIYDKVSTQYAYATSSGGISGLILGIGGGIAGVGGAGVNQSAGAASSTQRTLTIIIKFKDNLVKEFTYNSTSF